MGERTAAEDYRDPSSHARRILRANRCLQEILGGEGVPFASLDLLLFLAAEDAGPGVTTSRCCASIKAPRTTALRWIGALVASGAIEQRQDAEDGRVTVLRLTRSGRWAIETWMDTIADAAASRATMNTGLSHTHLEEALSRSAHA